jgi:site-specific DNA-methyltransferase (adenine-specific)
MYLATRFDVAAQWNNAICDADLTMKTPIYWDKGNHTSGDLEGDYGAQVELFLFAHKGRHLLRGRRLANLWKFPRDVASDHPTPKPVELLQQMLQCSTDDGSTVLDGFMGSGSTGVACVNLDRKFIGIEIEPKYFDIACKRIEKAYQDRSLLDLADKKTDAKSSPNLFPLSV